MNSTPLQELSCHGDMELLHLHQETEGYYWQFE